MCYWFLVTIGLGMSYVQCCLKHRYGVWSCSTVYLDVQPGRFLVGVLSLLHYLVCMCLINSMKGIKHLALALNLVFVFLLYVFCHDVLFV